MLKRGARLVDGRRRNIHRRKGERHHRIEFKYKYDMSAFESNNYVNELFVSFSLRELNGNQIVFEPTYRCRVGTGIDQM